MCPLVYRPSRCLRPQSLVQVRRGIPLDGQVAQVLRVVPRLRRLDEVRSRPDAADVCSGGLSIVSDYPIGTVLRKVIGVWHASLAVSCAQVSSVRLSPFPELGTCAWATETTTRTENWRRGTRR